MKLKKQLINNLFKINQDISINNYKIKDLKQIKIIKNNTYNKFKINNKLPF